MKSIITLIIFSLCSIISAQGQVINVPLDQPTIQSAINTSVDGDTVLVADGTYFENINFRGKAITVASHFFVDGDETHVDGTIIKANGGTAVQFGSGEDTTSVLYGFTITGGTGTYDPFGYGTKGAGGIGINNCGAKIQHNKITGNTISNNSASSEGGGILINANSNDVLILNNYITNNKVLTYGANDEGGGGIFIYNCPNHTITIANNVISDNVVSTTSGWLTGNGGAILLNHSKAVLRNNLIKNNSARYGGGIMVSDFKPTENPSFINNTIVNNEGTFGGGFYSDNEGLVPQMLNSIIWGNTAPTDPQLNSVVSVEYSDIEGGFTGTGNIDLDPLFEDTIDFYYDPLSPCVDAGFPLSMYHDMEDPGNPNFPLFPALGDMRNDMGHCGGNPNMVFEEFPESIVDLKVDSDGNFIPDRLNEFVTTTGVVSSINFQKSSGNLGFYIYSLDAGIYVFADNDDSTSFEIGDWIEIKGTIDHYSGLTEIVVANTKTDIVLLEHNHAHISQNVYIDELLKNPEKYEGMYIRVNAVKKTTGDWPTSASSTNLTITDGYKNLLLRVDDDTDLGSNPEPIYPIDLKGTVSQYSTSVPANDGYQILVNSFSDIEQNVQAAPSPYFFFTPESKAWEDNTYGITSQPLFIASLDWYSAIDLNEDNLTYEVAIIRDKDGVIIDEGPSDNVGSASRSSGTNAKLMKLIQDYGGYNTTDSVWEFTGSWVIRVTDGNTRFVASVDTIRNFTIQDFITTGVDEENTIPYEYALNQNYPNPFNPTTKIRYTILEKSLVTLKVYNVLGKEVKTLVKENQNLGKYEINFDASDLSSGVYFYQLTAGKFIETKKMLLLR